MIKLRVKEKGHMVHIPGAAPFRTPAKIDITNMKLSLVVTILNNNGISDFEITSTEDKERIVYTKKDFELTKQLEEPKQDLSEINDRFNKIEKMLYALSKKDSKKNIPEEQITNKLNALEELSKRILEKESVREIVYTSTKDRDGSPIVEELDEDTFVPEIDISDMELKGGSSAQTLGEIEGAEEAADMLSRLKD